MNVSIDHIVSRLDEPVRLKDLAQVARLSPFHFHRVFQAIVGATPSDFVKRLRLDRALGMMAHSRGMSLTTIALSCGFASSSDFSRSFKQRFGVPPSAFDIVAWRKIRGNELTVIPNPTERLESLPPRRNPDGFKVRIRDLPQRTVAYIRVSRPYQDNAVVHAAERLMSWVDREEPGHGQWLGYQWDNPEITPLEDCRYHVSVEAEDFRPVGEIGRFTFPRMTVAEVTVKGSIELELRALYWLYGTWLPRSGYVPDDHPCFEAWTGRPFAHGTEHFDLKLQLPIRRR